MEITAAQCRAARGLLGWSQTQLAEAAAVSIKTVSDLEGGKRAHYDRTVSDIRRTLEEAGIQFIPKRNGAGVGVRFKDSSGE